MLGPRPLVAAAAALALALSAQGALASARVATEGLRAQQAGPFGRPMPTQRPLPARQDRTTAHSVSLRLQQDFLLMGGREGACAAGQPKQYSCFRSGQEPRLPTLPVVGSGGRIRSGFGLATTRLLLGYTWAQSPRYSLGGALGWALRGGAPETPSERPFMPLHAELEALYWFRTGFARVPGLRLYAGLSGGLARVDSSVVTEVLDRDPIGGGVRRSSVQAWKKAGLLFLGASGGAAYSLPQGGQLRLGLKLQVLAPASGLGAAIQSGYTHSF